MTSQPSDRDYTGYDQVQGPTAGLPRWVKVFLLVAVAVAVLGYLYYDRSRTPVVKIDVPGFSGEITKDKKGVDIEVGKD